MYETLIAFLQYDDENVGKLRQLISLQIGYIFVLACLCDCELGYLKCWGLVFVKFCEQKMFD